MQLSQHFTLAELCRSRRATREGIRNEPTEAQVANLRSLAVHVLQPIRDFLGRPLCLSSGFRCLDLNTKEGGAPDSQHLCLQDCAAGDFEAPGVDNLVLAHHVRRCMDAGVALVDELILEFYTTGVPTSGWIHVGHRAQRTNRGRISTASWGADGKRIYTPGLPPLPLV